MRTRLLTLAVTALVVCSIGLAAGAAPENLIFILDASNSMNKPFDENTRIVAARSALAQLLAGLPEQGNVGLMIYGHRINHENEVESCQDIALLFPLAPFTASVGSDMIAAFQQVEAKGMTPLADSLVTAANELDAGGTIILVSDGEGNCGGQHAVIAQMLATMDPPIILHVVGIDVEDEASQTLRAIALETGGSYWRVSEASGLLDALYAAVAPAEIVSEPAIRPSGIPSEYACRGITNVIEGTDGDDTLYGTEENDLILGYGGDDFLIGLDGNDILVGGDGSDILEGGTGNDFLDGGEGVDLLFGGVQNDVLCGGPGNDSLEGESGDDILDGGEGRDVLLGGTGADRLYSADAADVLLEGRAIAGTCEMCIPQCAPIPAAPVCPMPIEPPCPTPTLVSAPVCPVPSGVKTLNEGESIQLHGTVSDSDCNVAQILWQVSAGMLDDPISLDPVYTAPMLGGCDGIDVQVSLAAVDSCGASASDSFILRVNNVNHAPAVDAGRDLCVDEGTSVVLQAASRDPDGDALSYRWTVASGGGSLEDPAALQAVYHAPLIDDCDGRTVTLTLSVVDPCGASACDSVVVRVRNVNRAPSVDLGPDFALDEGSAVRLTPVVVDPECEQLKYCWTVTGGVLDRPDVANPMFAAPLTECCDGLTLTIKLTVVDPCGLSASDSVAVYVRNVNGPPSVDLGPPLTINEGECIRLTPDVIDLDGDLLKYAWTTTGGILSDSCMGSPVFTAPMVDVCEGVDLVITLTVVDPCGLTATDSLCVHVANVNQPPLVYADP
jgi:hypothetical protein